MGQIGKSGGANRGGVGRGAMAAPGGMVEASRMGGLEELDDGLESTVLHDSGCTVLDESGGSYRYTREALQAVFLFVGVRPKASRKLAENVFGRIRQDEEPGTSKSASIRRERFVDLVRHALLSLGYSRPQQLVDFSTACGIRERRASVTILLCGTSGCGKSTLASLLASRLGINSVLSTDSVRNMLRSFDTGRENKFIWSSTYDTGAVLEGLDSPGSGGGATTQRKAVIRGYKAQSEMVVEHLGNLIDHTKSRGESLIIEGVHLSMNFMMRLMERHDSVFPFVVFISNEQKHKERFAVRARAMALTRAKNKYVNHFRNIRIIQSYLCRKADKHLLPKIDNSNIDRSVAAIHTILLGCLRSSASGAKETAAALHGEFEKLNQGHMWGGKDMLQLIRQKKTVATPAGKGLEREATVYYEGKGSGRGLEGAGGEQGELLSSGAEEERDLVEEDEEEEEQGELGESSRRRLGLRHTHVSDAGSVMESHEDSGGDCCGIPGVQKDGGKKSPSNQGANLP